LPRNDLSFKAQVLFIAQTIGTALKDSDFVVEALDEAEKDSLLQTFFPAAQVAQCEP